MHLLVRRCAIVFAGLAHTVATFLWWWARDDAEGTDADYSRHGGKFPNNTHLHPLFVFGAI
jgi:hypothetical protein